MDDIIELSELDVCILAFKHKQADAEARTERLKARLMRDFERIKPLAMKQAQYQVRAAELAADIAKVDGVLKKYGGRYVAPPGLGPTAELLAQVRKGRKGDPILRLVAFDYLTFEHFASAREIASIVHAETRSLLPKITNLPTASDQGDDPAWMRMARARDWAEEMALVHCFVYLPWADQVRRDIPLIHAICLDGESVNYCARKYRMWRMTVVDKLKAGLELYGKMREGYDLHGPAANPRNPAPGSAMPLRAKPRP